jgi:hypothetical protein
VSGVCLIGSCLVIGWESHLSGSEPAMQEGGGASCTCSMQEEWTFAWSRLPLQWMYVATACDLTVHLSCVLHTVVAIRYIQWLQFVCVPCAFSPLPRACRHASALAHGLVPLCCVMSNLLYLMSSPHPTPTQACVSCGAWAGATTECVWLPPTSW